MSARWRWALVVTAGWPEHFWRIAMLVALAPGVVFFFHGVEAVWMMATLAVILLVVARGGSPMDLSAPDRRRVAAAMLFARATGDSRLDDWVEYVALKQQQRSARIANRVVVTVAMLLLVAVPIVSAAVRGPWWWLVCLVGSFAAVLRVVPTLAVRPVKILAALHPDVTA